MNIINKKNFVPDIAKMKRVANILGVKIDEPFHIQFFSHRNAYKYCIYKLTPEGLFYSYKNNGDYIQKSSALEGLLVGKHQVIKIKS